LPVIQDSGQGCLLIVWNDRSLLQIYDPRYKIPAGLSVDYVIISNNAVGSVQELHEQIDAKNLILDSSNSRYKVSKLLRGDKPLHTIHSVQHHGAFELRI